MSSIDREPLEGLIRQDQKVVGAICLPETDPHEFIEQFNNCYGPLRMQIAPPALRSFLPKLVAPVGAARIRSPLAPTVLGSVQPAKQPDASK